MNNDPYSSPDTHAGYGVTPYEPLTPTQIFFSFTGRISRSTFWIYMIVLNVVGLVAFGILWALMFMNSTASQPPNLYP